jgi:hypothetical protein
MELQVRKVEEWETPYDSPCCLWCHLPARDYFFDAAKQGRSILGVRAPGDRAFNPQIRSAATHSAAKSDGQYGLVELLLHLANATYRTPVIALTGFTGFRRRDLAG